MKTRLELRAQIVSCTSCDLSTRCQAPVPFDGPSPAKLVVVGEAPGKQEDEQGKPFVGPAGQLLKELMAAAGLPVSETMFVNAASCFPIDFEGKGRAPNDVEIAACNVNLTDQLELAQAPYVLLAGGVPLKAVRPGLKISQARGNPFLMGSTATKTGERLALATFHPSYVLRRGGKDSDAGVSVLEDMTYLRRLMDAGPDGWVNLFPDTCVACDEWATRFDDDGFGWCVDHWKGK